MMVRSQARDFQEYSRLKEDAVAKVTKENAQEMFDSAKNKMMADIQKLDVHNVTDIENLYLIAAQLTQAAACLAAINKSVRKDTSFEEEIDGIGMDDVATVLFNAFKDAPQVSSLSKIDSIDTVHKPAKEAWAGLHSRMLLTSEATRAYHIKNVLTKSLPEYKEHLERKLREHGVAIPPPQNMPEEASSSIKKMVARYYAVSDLEQRIQHKDTLTPGDVKFAKEQVKKCLDNKPEWAERPFLQKLTDVLSLGMKPLYRAYFSKENELQKTLEHSVEPPKMR